jgi:hypothetical protein
LSFVFQQNSPHFHIDRPKFRLNVDFFSAKANIKQQNVDKKRVKIDFFCLKNGLILPSLLIASLALDCHRPWCEAANVLLQDVTPAGECAARINFRVANAVGCIHQVASLQSAEMQCRRDVIMQRARGN